MVSLGQKLKMPKTCQKPLYKNIRFVLWKKPFEKTPIFEKSGDFENRPSCKGSSPCKAYSLCKMVSLIQKLKMPKTCQKPFQKNIRVFLCKKSFEKTPNIRKIRRFWKWAILKRLKPLQNRQNRPPYKGYSPCKGYSFCIIISWGQKLKIPKTCRKPSYENITVVQSLQKTVRKNTKYQEKYEMRVNKIIGVFPSNKKLDKTRNLREMSKLLKETKNVIFEFLERVESISYRKLLLLRKGLTRRYDFICIKREKWAPYNWTRCQSVVPNDVPRGFGPVIAFRAKFQIPVARQWGKDMSPKTICDRSLSSTWFIT